jgi:hypothetical protein
LIARAGGEGRGAAEYRSRGCEEQGEARAVPDGDLPIELWEAFLTPGNRVGSVSANPEDDVGRLPSLKRPY